MSRCSSTRCTPAGVERVFKDVGSGSLKHRPELGRCLEQLREGDTLLVCGSAGAWGT
jgi:DNA invertase Pin-like site-specific DNA recombinase